MRISADWIVPICLVALAVLIGFAEYHSDKNTSKHPKSQDRLPPYDVQNEVLDD